MENIFSLNRVYPVRFSDKQKDKRSVINYKRKLDNDENIICADSDGVSYLFKSV